MAGDEKQTDAGKPPAYLEFHYQKSPLYRAVHADGIYGGPTPRGLMAISFFSERQVIPRHVKRPVVGEADKSLLAGPEEVVESLNGIVRHVETTIFMDVMAAQEFFTWFEGHLRTLEDGTGIPPERRVTRKVESE